MRVITDVIKHDLVMGILTKRLIMLCFAIIFPVFLFPETPEELLFRVDSRRVLDDMCFSLTITSYDGITEKDRNSIWGFSKNDSGRFKFLLYFTAPANVKGKKMLIDRNTDYVLFPKTRNPIRISPLQILMGEVSCADVVRTVYSSDYDITTLREDVFVEERNEPLPCHVFDLTVKEASKDLNYKRIILWVGKESLLPVYAEFFASSSRLMKRAFYRQNTEVLGKIMPYLTDIYSAEHPQKHTIISIESVGQKPLPLTMFNRTYLPSWTPEEPR